MSNRESGGRRLAALPGLEPKRFELIAQKRDADSKAIDRALEIVRGFIQERDLILYGGLAIDYALRLRGSRIYPDEERPDFDFFSPRSVHDAYDLAETLAAAGFKNVGAIRAIHVQTMRVRFDFVGVADISYAPPEVFASLPTVNYRGMRVLHPDYQRTDMHLAFCFPFNNPPREDVFHRFAKDLRRFNLFEEYYPITSAAGLGEPVTGGGAAAAPSAATFAAAEVAIHGMGAYAILRDAYEELRAAAESTGVAPRELRAPRVAHRVSSAGVVAGSAGRPGGERLRLELRGFRILLASPAPARVVDGLREERPGAPVTYHRPYMDSRPAMAIVGGGARESPVEVYSVKDRLLAVSAVRVPGVERPVYVVTPQYLLLHLLYEAHVAPRDSPGRTTFVEFYRHTLEVLAGADETLAAMRERVSPEEFDRVANTTPFVLTTRVLGGANENEAYRINLARSVKAVGDPPRPDLPSLADLPRDFFPGRSGPRGTRPDFDYAANPLFRRDGLVSDQPTF